MILLRNDCLVFEMNNGDQIPCSVAQVTVELMGGAADHLDHEMVQHAAAAVLHYFRHELQRSTVTLGEFTAALETALRGLGLEVTCDTPEPSAPAAVGVAAATVAPSDLRQLATESGHEFELGFFPRLRETVRKDLSTSPQLLRFSGLRGCVKQLAGARRWSPRCEQLSDQIVEYLRGCLVRENPSQPCGLMVI